MLGVRALSTGSKTVRRTALRRSRCCALATVLALPLTLHASGVTTATPSLSGAAFGSGDEWSPPTSEITLVAQQYDARPDHSVSRGQERAGSVEVSSPKGSRTWSASSLTDNGLPAAARRAYERAAQAMAGIDPACQLPWTLLAGVGRIESDHGRYGGSVLGENGVSRPLIIGVPLNGVGPVAAIPDTDDGRLDKDKVWDRAVGPMQFIPSTWAGAARDGDGDGVRSPNDIDDAALAAAAYLCAGSGSVLGDSAMRAAIYRYNASEEYVALVMAMEAGYRTGVFVMPVFVTDEPGDRPKRRKRSGGGHSTGGGGKQHGSSGGGSQTSDGGTSQGTSQQGGGTSTSGGGGGGGGGGDKDGGGKGGDTTTSPPPSPPPSPEPEPEPTTEQRSGTLAPCGTGWCLDGWALDVGGDAKLGQPAAHDYDGDGVAGETNQQELEGLAGSNVTVVVKYGTAIVLEVKGLPYA